MKKQVLLFPAVLAIIGTISCRGPQPDIENCQIKHAGKMLQNAQDSVDKWGRISVSDLLLIENKGQFKVTYNEDASNYVAAARGNFTGTSSAGDISSEYFGASVTAELTPHISLGSMAAAGASNTPPPGTIASPASGALSSIAPLLSLSGINPAIDERTAVQKGINDKIAEMLLEFMANPDVGSNQQKVVFGVMQVTCQPGSYTGKNYAANLNVSIKYARQSTGDGEKTNAVPNRTGSIQYKIDGGQPTVIAVLPLLDSQNLALANSSRNQLEVAAQLAIAFAAQGLNVGANIMNDYIKRQQSDINTRNSIPVATSYTDGSSFGFEIYPSLMAQSNPGDAKSSPGKILQPITFPAVVAILIDKVDLNLKKPAGTNIVHDVGPGNIISSNRPPAAWSKQSSSDIGESATMAHIENVPETPDDSITAGSSDSSGSWTYVQTELRTDWIPLDGGSDKLKMNERLERAQDMDCVSSVLQSLRDKKSAIPDPYWYRKEQLQIALDSLVNVGLGNLRLSSLPSDLFANPEVSEARIIDVYPHVMWRDQTTEFAVLVTNVASPRLISIAGLTVQGGDTYSFANNQTLIVGSIKSGLFASITNATNSVEFVVQGENRAVSKVVPLAIMGRVTGDAVATIARDPNGKITSFDIKSGPILTETDMLNALKAILEKSEPPPKTTNIVK